MNGSRVLSRIAMPVLVWLALPLPAQQVEFRDWADVLRVEPLVETREVPVTRERCENQALPLQQALPVASALGEDIRRQQRQLQTRTNCRTLKTWEGREQATGYLVTYRYQGQEYTRRMARHPGDRVAVDVSLSPEP